MELTSCERDAREEFVTASPTSRGSIPSAAPNFKAYIPVSRRRDCNLSRSSCNRALVSPFSSSNWFADSWSDRTLGSHRSKSLLSSLKRNHFFVAAQYFFIFNSRRRKINAFDPYLNLLYCEVIISGDSVKSIGSLARILISIFSSQRSISSMIRWNCWLDMSATCRCCCQRAAKVHTFSHLVLAMFNRSLSCVARHRSSLWSARWTPTVFRLPRMLLWLSRSSRNSLWSCIISSSSSILFGGECCSLCVPSANSNHFSNLHISFSSWAQLGREHNG